MIKKFKDFLNENIDWDENDFDFEEFDDKILNLKEIKKLPHDEIDNIVHVGSKIFWTGRFVSGYQEGTNKVVEIFYDLGFKQIRLDNDKEFFLYNMKKDRIKN